MQRGTDTSINQTGHAVNKLSKPQGYEDKPQDQLNYVSFVERNTHGKLVYVLRLEKFALHVTKEIIFKAPQYVQLEV